MIVGDIETPTRCDDCEGTGSRTVYRSIDNIQDLIDKLLQSGNEDAMQFIEQLGW